MNVAHPGPWPKLEEHDAQLMDVARRIQLTKTKHEAAETSFRALCKHVDREGMVETDARSVLKLAVTERNAHPPAL